MPRRSGATLVRPPGAAAHVVTNTDIGTDYWVEVVRRQLIARYGERGSCSAAGSR